MKKIKKVLSVLLAVTMMISVLSVLTVSSSASASSAKHWCDSTSLKNGYLAYDYDIILTSTSNHIQMTVRLQRLISGTPSTWSTVNSWTKYDVSGSIRYDLPTKGSYRLVLSGNSYKNGTNTGSFSFTSPTYIY